MNERINRLPRYKDFPVPFFVTWRTDGVPDFKVMNEDNRMKCYTHRLCWICGEKLGSRIVFIGGPRAIELRMFVDGPMHRDCALDAMAICPYLIGTMDYATAPDLSKHAEGVAQMDVVRKQAPEKIGLYLTRDFDAVLLSGTFVFQPTEPISIEWRERKGHP